jgi:hypothetical protein
MEVLTQYATCRYCKGTQVCTNIHAELMLNLCACAYASNAHMYTHTHTRTHSHISRAGDHIRSATRKYTGPVAAVPSEDGEGGGGPSEIVVTKQRPSTWQTIHEKVGLGLNRYDRQELSGKESPGWYFKRG